MVDITLQVVIVAPTEVIPTNVQDKYNRQAARMKIGDIISVSQTNQERFAKTPSGDYRIINGPILSPRFGFVHVTDVPVPIALKAKKLKRMLTREVVVPADGEDPEHIVDMPVRNNKFRVDVANIPNQLKQRMQADKEVTVTWLQARNYIKKKAFVNADDDSQDTEDDFVDGDLDE